MSKTAIIKLFLEQAIPGPKGTKSFHFDRANLYSYDSLLATVDKEQSTVLCQLRTAEVSSTSKSQLTALTKEAENQGFTAIHVSDLEQHPDEILASFYQKCLNQFQLSAAHTNKIRERIRFLFKQAEKYSEYAGVTNPELKAECAKLMFQHQLFDIKD